MDLLLRNNVKVNYKGNKLRHPLTLACSKDNVEIVKMLINNGANVNYYTPQNWTPFIQACMS